LEDTHEKQGKKKRKKKGTGVQAEKVDAEDRRDASVPKVEEPKKKKVPKIYLEAMAELEAEKTTKKAGTNRGKGNKVENQKKTPSKKKANRKRNV
jgi:chromatin segregation and condensation protein Rec8/ScpA/Scc1 (kleisin family)